LKIKSKFKQILLTLLNREIPLFISIFLTISFLISFVIVQPVNSIVSDTVRKNTSFFKADNVSLEDTQMISELSTYESANVLGVNTINKTGKITFDLISTDVRTKVLEEYFVSIRSPLVGQASIFIEMADKYKLDKWGLLPAIAMIETNGCRTENQRGYGIRNCWGWRRNGKDIRFSTWDDSIGNITKSLAKYNTDPFSIQPSYCPPCEASGNDLWAKGVVSELRKINEIGKKYGVPEFKTR
jgi:hypothetical protein